MKSITKWTLICFVILGPCLFTFFAKLEMLIDVFRGDPEWAFAVSPVVNYILASAGFVCLFFWAVKNGMFRDMEQPKLQLLENEAMLDELEQCK
jgi:nitrogen fixation-related uncharacterized protein